MRNRIKRTAERILTATSMKIVRYTAACAILALTACQPQNSGTVVAYMPTDCTPDDTAWVRYAAVNGAYNDTAPLRLSLCENVLKLCITAELLDSADVETYLQITAAPSAARYIELISECEAESTFYDTVGETDAYIDYCMYVLNDVDY